MNMANDLSTGIKDRKKCFLSTMFSFKNGLFFGKAELYSLPSRVATKSEESRRIAYITEVNRPSSEPANF